MSISNVYFPGKSLRAMLITVCLKNLTDEAVRADSEHLAALGICVVLGGQNRALLA